MLLKPKNVDSEQLSELLEPCRLPLHHRPCAQELAAVLGEEDSLTCKSHPFWEMELSLGSHHSLISYFLHENPSVLAKVYKWKDGNPYIPVLHREGIMANEAHTSIAKI